MARIVGYIPPKKAKAPPGNAKGSRKPGKTDTSAAPAEGAAPPKEA